jgi:hypothetical protein
MKVKLWKGPHNGKTFDVQTPGMEIRLARMEKNNRSLFTEAATGPTVSSAITYDYYQPVYVLVPHAGELRKIPSYHPNGLWYYGYVRSSNA